MVVAEEAESDRLSIANGSSLLTSGGRGLSVDRQGQAIVYQCLVQLENGHHCEAIEYLYVDYGPCEARADVMVVAVRAHVEVEEWVAVGSAPLRLPALMVKVSYYRVNCFCASSYH